MENYILDVFSPETWKAFRESDGQVTGFRARQRRVAGERVAPGDVFLCYLTRLSRWCRALRVESEVYEDASPVFGDPDPYTVRFRVQPIVILEPEFAIPIHDDEVWNTLTITKKHDKRQTHWTGFIRSSLNRFDDADGRYLLRLLEESRDQPKRHPFTEQDRRKLTLRTVRTLDREVEVEVPEDQPSELPAADDPVAGSGRESIRMQAKVAHIGASMGFRIWVPRNDRRQVQEYVPDDLCGQFLDDLPLNYNDTTIRTIEQIDVLWLKGRSMARAFEIEHTTAIYSGILRMADLLALQPNMDIRLHVVAPDDRREQVLREIRRPVFSLLEREPLYDQCSYLSYESIQSLGESPDLPYMKDAIIDKYEETAEV